MKIEFDLYACGHKGKIVILDDNILNMAEYLTWKDSVGFEGDNSMCWDCWCKKEVPKE